MTNSCSGAPGVTCATSCVASTGACAETGLVIDANANQTLDGERWYDGDVVIKNSSEAVGLQSKPTLTRDEEAKIIGQTTTNWDFAVAKNLAEANLTAAKAAELGLETVAPA